MQKNNRRSAQSIVFLFTLALIITVCCTSQSQATPVSEETARTVALNWYTHRAPANLDAGKIAIDHMINFSTDEFVDCYVFAFRPAGFVVVSGDDATTPIIGYSYDSPVQAEITHPAVEEFFNSVQAQLQWVRSENIDNSPTLPLWQEIIDNTIPPRNRDRDVEPLLTTTWYQDCGYNTECPYDNDGPCDHAVTGCVATAMGQVMKYWGHPVRGTGWHGYTHPEYGYLNAYFGATIYNWTGMPDDYGDEDVAELLYHCGVAVEMDYGPDGSGAFTSSVEFALEDYFDYANCYYETRADYSGGWGVHIMADLYMGRPVVLHGGGSSGTHAFVCDGFQGDDFDHYFHFNWGWGGVYDGYFDIDDLTPGSYNFTANQGGVFWIRPNSVVTPYPVDDLTISLQDNDVLLAWSAEEGAEEYNIYRLAEPYATSGPLLGTTTGTAFTCVDELDSYASAFYIVRLGYNVVPDFTYIPHGWFWMGSNEGDTDEMPVHGVALTHDFLLGTHEVTNQEYLTALQWAYEQGYVNVDDDDVHEGASGLWIARINDDRRELKFDTATGQFSLQAATENWGDCGPGYVYPSGYDPADHPVKYVTWHGAAFYCDWLSEREGLTPFYNGNWDQTDGHNPYQAEGYRLPTAAEWEYAACYNDYVPYPWGDEDIDCGYANHMTWWAYCVGWTTPVGSHPAGNNQLGLQDIVGNVKERVGDWFSETYYEISPLTDPLGPLSGQYRLSKGGCWATNPYYCRCQSNHIGPPYTISYEVGFRVARIAPPREE